MKKRMMISVLAVVLTLSLALCGCNTKQTDKDKVQSESSGTQQTDNNSNISNMTDSNDSDNVGEETTDSQSNYKKPSYSKPSYKPVHSSVATADDTYTYDIKVTTFNVGGFYHGVDNGMHADGQYAEWVPGNLNAWLEDIAQYDSDIFAFQEFCPLFYSDPGNNINLMAKDVFGNVFKTLDAFEGSTESGNLPVYMAFGAQHTSKYNITDITMGYLSSKSADARRPYLKGYVTVDGVKIAVYNVHLGFKNMAVVRDSYTELINLMRNEDYCVVMGDTNTNEIASIFKKAGMNVANMDAFGNFQTYEYDTESYIDNIFTTPNIDINYVEAEVSKAGGSDHYPLSAYLKINKKMGSTKQTDTNKVSSDGFIDGWYKP